MYNMSLHTPVAFLIFNRPDLTKKVFEAIRQAKPKKLLVIADGARFTEEVEKCQQTRAIINTVDWDCEVLTNFSETNLGCKKRVSSGLDWVFSQVEEAIILEDDCLPAPSFFYYCQTLLEKYRDDKRIMHISGSNFQRCQIRTEYSYYFSKYIHIWGWATWKRAWKYYDVDIKSWSKSKKSRAFDSLFCDCNEQKYWTNILEQVIECAIDTWDYQWFYTCWVQNSLAITPERNLISNLGFGIDATHTLHENDHNANLPVFDLWDIQHPSLMVRQQEADLYTFDNRYGGLQISFNQHIHKRIRRKISKLKAILKSSLNFVTQ